MAKIREPKLPEEPQDFAHIDSERYRLRASEVKLSPEERALLKDPDWVDEDDADLIICLRREKEEGNRAIPFREYLRRRGIKVENTGNGPRIARPASAPAVRRKKSLLRHS
jgi:hypothetical protein